MTENNSKTGPSPEQLLYANFLNKGMFIGLFILIITFILYISGIVKSYIPVQELSKYWHLNVHDYLQHLDIPDGWGWLGMLYYSDFLNFIGVAFLAGITIVCYMAIVPSLLKNNDKIYAYIAIAEVIVLLAAATGLIASGGH